MGAPTVKRLLLTLEQDDSQQMHNQLASETASLLKILSYDIQFVVNRLDALIIVIKLYKGEFCIYL